MFDLAGKVALVAGGAGWLGLPVCQKLAEQGAAVAVADIDITRAEAALQPGTRMQALFLDAADERSISQAVTQTVAAFGRLDILVNATLAAAGKSLDEITAEEFDRTLHTNLVGNFLLAREAARAMQDGGSMVFFASMYGVVAPDPKLYQPPMQPNPIEYGVAKAGVIQMARYLAVHWAARKIRVNAVIPGAFSNARVQSDDPAFIDRLAAKAPLGRIGRREEVAGAVVYLASDEASYVTGTTLVVDGGWTAI